MFDVAPYEQHFVRASLFFLMCVVNELWLNFVLCVSIKLADFLNGYFSLFKCSWCLFFNQSSESRHPENLVSYCVRVYVVGTCSASTASWSRSSWWTASRGVRGAPTAPGRTSSSRPLSASGRCTTAPASVRACKCPFYPDWYMLIIINIDSMCFLSTEIPDFINTKHLKTFRWAEHKIVV